MLAEYVNIKPLPTRHAITNPLFLTASNAISPSFYASHNVRSGLQSSDSISLMTLTIADNSYCIHLPSFTLGKALAKNPR